VVYGRNPVREALRGRREVIEVLATERAAASLDWLREAPLRVASAAAVGQLAGSADHQGVAARVEPYPYADAEELLVGPAPLVVALDEITDPHNLGAIARTAECAGADGLVLPRHGSALVTPAVCKASAGAVEHLPIAIATNLADLLERAKRPGLWSYGAAAQGEQLHTDADLRDGAIFVIGAEGKGLRPRVEAACDVTVRLPLRGRIGSLNASVAAAVLLYEAVRQRA
jgi:23S rRNA (guanosine2251-2'-O)-methyltransferase